jgi:hypothetical protein
MENFLERTEKKQCGPWAELCIADGGIEGRRRPDLAGKGWGSGPCSPRVRFWCLDGSEEVPTMGKGGAVDLRP